MLPYQSISRKEDGIVIVGLGGAGANILQRFSGSSADNVRLCIMSLDERLGRECGNVEFLQLGAGLNHGLGSGGDPEMGRLAVAESKEQILELLKDARLLVMVVGLGGGTGSGVAPVLAQMARDAGVFLVSVLVMPFAFEGRRRREQADQALETIASVSDLVYCFENDYMEDLFRSRQGAQAVFEEANNLLSQATASVPMLANSPGIINIGLDELVTTLRNNDSRCIYGVGTGYGPHRAEDAAKAALASPLVAYHQALRFARAVVVHVAGGKSMGLSELRQAVDVVRAAIPAEDVNIFFGACVKPRLGEEIRVSIISSVDANEFRAALETEAAERLAEAEAAAAAAALAQQDDEPEEELVEDSLSAEEEMAPAPVPQPMDNIFGDPEEEAEEVEEIEEDEPEVAEEPTPSRMAMPERPRRVVPPPSHPAPRRSFIPQPVVSQVPSPGAVTPTRPAAPEKRSAAVSRREELFEKGGMQSLFNLDGEPVRGVLTPDVEDEYDERVRDLFPEEGGEMQQPERYTPEASRRRMRGIDDDEREFAARYNDLRDMFPE